MFSYAIKKPANFIISGLFLALLLAFSNSSFAEPPSPFLTRNQSPFSLIYGLPLASPAKLLNKDDSRWISSLNASNTLNKQDKGNESLLLDIETWQLNLIYDHSFKENWMLRLQLPLISHSGGFLDSPIDAYHQAVGLPEDLRPAFPHDQIDVVYSQNDIELMNIQSRQQSIGDISAQLAWQAQQTESQSLSYWMSLKLPTGDADKLTGSNGVDIAAWAAMDYQLTQTGWLYTQAGALYMSNSDVLTSIQKNWAVFANLGFSFRPWDMIELKSQLDIHSAFYDSDIEFLDHVIQLTFGGTYLISQRHKLDLAIAEDIKNGASPDVNFNISWSIYY